jgi:hypothetical protein
MICGIQSALWSKAMTQAEPGTHLAGCCRPLPSYLEAVSVSPHSALTSLGSGTHAVSSLCHLFWVRSESFWVLFLPSRLLAPPSNWVLTASVTSVFPVPRHLTSGTLGI